MAVHAPVCSMEKLSTTVFGQLSRKFPFRLSRMATLLTRLKPELCSTIQGGCLMIGRAAQGRPWIFREIQHYLDTGELLPPLPLAEVKRLLCAHVRELHDFYGPAKGTELHVNTFPGISRNTLQMTSFGAHSTPLRMPANSWRRWRHTSKILRKQK